MDMIPFPELPPEFQQAVKEQLAHSQMKLNLKSHETVAFIDGLDKEQLRALLHMVQATGMEKPQTSFYMGYLVALMHERHDLCGACGHDHAADVSTMAEAERMKGGEKGP